MSENDFLGLGVDDPPLYEAPVHEWLFAAVAQATADAVGVISDRVVAQGFVLPKVSFPTLGEFEGGMPHVEYGTVEDVPDYRSVVTTSPTGEDWKVDLSDRPSFRGLLEAVREDEEVAGRLGFPGELDDDVTNLLLRGAVFGLAMSLAERWLLRYGVATDFAAGMILDDYLRLEAPLVRERLPADVVVPIVATPFEPDHLELDYDVALVKLPERFQLARVPNFNTGSLGHRCLVSAATHAIVLPGVEFPMVGYWNPTLRDLRWYPVDLIDQALAALRIVSPLEFGVAQLVLRPRGWVKTYDADLPPAIAGPEVKWYPSYKEERGWLEPTDVVPTDTVVAAAEALRGLRAAKPRVLLAARKLNDSVLRDSPDDVVLDSCTGLEALLGGDGTEITYKLQIRAAAVLQAFSGALNAAEAVQVVKSTYGVRSAIVHGTGRSSKPVRWPDGSELPAFVAARTLLRWVLHVITVTPPLATAREAGKSIDEILVFPSIDLLRVPEPDPVQYEPVEEPLPAEQPRTLGQWIARLLMPPHT